MKKLFFIVFLCLFSLSLIASDGIIILNDAKDGNNVPLKSYSINRIELNAISSSIAYSIVEQDGLLFADLKFNNGSIIGDYGAPKLPAFYRLIVIPENADYEVYYSKGSYIDIDLLAETGTDIIYPIQLPVPKSGEQEIEFQMDSDIYFEDALYPKTMTTVHEEMRGRGIRLLPISIIPAEYNPVTGNLRVYTEVNIEIRLSNADMRATKRHYDRYLSTYSDIYINSSLGFEELNNQIGSREPYYHGEGLLIITADEFSAGMQDFIEWKEIKGYRVTETLISEIPNSNTTAGIKTYIQNAYDNWDIPPSHIILVGGANHIPTFTGPVSNSASDQFYVFLDGDDYFPDAAISRFTVLNENQLNTYLNKIMYYEEFGNSDLSWMTDAALISGEDFGWYEVGEGTLNYAVDNYLDPLGWDYDKLYRHTYDATKAEVIASMNAGKMIANFTAHCGPQTWAFRSGQYIVNADIHALTNQDMYFYAIGNCCTSATFDTTTETIGEAFIVADNAAIAYWGASNSTYWGPDDILAKRSYDGFFEEGIQLLAPNSDYSKVQLWLHYGGDTQSQRYMEYYLVFGDGTTFIPRVSPTAMNVNAPVLVPSGSTSMAVSVASAKGPVNNALVSAWMPELNVRGIARTDSTGNAVIDFDNPVTIPGEFLLTVTHPDHINNSSMVMVGTSSEGYVSFNKELYNCTDEVEIMLMDEDLAGLGTYTLHVNSTTDPAGIDVDLTETEFEGVFQGSFLLTTDLSVSHDDTITVEYYDADTGDGTGSLITDTALIDCEGPEFFNIEILTVTGNSAIIAFDTDEPATAIVNYGEEQDNLNMTQTISVSYRTSHQGTITGLTPNTDYYFEIIATDIVDNENTSDIYDFTTLNIYNVGDGNEELTHAPLYCFFRRNRTQIIYLSSDLGNNPMLISSIGIDITATPVLTLENWTIRMKHTDKADHSAGQGFEIDDWTIVYQNDESINETGWITFELIEPFFYNGVENLMIDFSFDNPDWASPSGKARWTSAPSSQTILAYSDSVNDPLNWQGTTNPTANTSNHFLNLELGLINIDPEPDGEVFFDKDFYACDDIVTITVMDSNVLGGFAPVTITSTTDPVGIDINLPEIELGKYQATITLGTDIDVNHDDTLTVSYLDEDIGDGTSELKTDTAMIDCAPPEIMNIHVSNIFGNSADFSFETDKPAKSKVIWGSDCDNLNNDYEVSSTFKTEHSGTVYGFAPNSTIYFSIIAECEAGNEGTSDCDSFSTANVIGIGDGTEELTQAPLYTYFMKNRTSTIYRNYELGSGKDIKEARPFYSLSIDVSKIPETILNNFTIRIKHTDRENFADGLGFEANDWTIVYQADETIDTIGWNTFHFQGGPFIWNGEDHIMVDISFFNPAWTPLDQIGRCHWTGTSCLRTIYGYADSLYGDPLDWSGTTEPTAQTTAHLLNIQITLEESETPIPPSGLTAITISSTQIDLSWNDNSTNEDGFVIQRKDGADGTWEDLATLSENTEFYSDTSVEPVSTYYYRVYAFNDAGNSAYSNEVSANTITLADALNNHDLSWTSYGDAEWFGQSDEYYYGGMSAQGGPITHNQSTTLETTVEGPVQISFYWKIDSESNYDFLTFYINAQQMQSISGNIDWHQVSFDIPAGTNTLRWVYDKDGSVSVGADTGWVDYVSLDTLPPDASISSDDISYSPESPLPGDLVTLSARVWNLGHDDITSGTISFYHSLIPEVDLELITAESFGTIPGGDYIDISIDWDTTGLEERPYTITVELTDIMPSDSNPDNNTAIIEIALPVELAYFNAIGILNRANIRWKTLSETDNLGFNLYRLNVSHINPFQPVLPVKLNTSLIPGQGTTSTPHEYSFTDHGINHRFDYVYILESVSVHGETKEYRTNLLKIGIREIIF